MATAKEYSMMFKLGASLDSKYSTTFNKASAEIREMQKELDAVQKNQSNITAYVKQQQAIEASRKKLEDLTKMHESYRRELEQTENPSEALTRSTMKAEQAMARAAANVEQSEKRLSMLSTALKEAEIDTNDLTGASNKLVAEYDDISARQQQLAESAGNAGNEMAGAFNAVQDALVAAGIAKMLSEIYSGLMECVDASIAFESGMAGVDKTTDLTKAELRDMGQAMKQLSTDIPITTDDLTKLGESAGQLGIAKQDLLSFSTTMGMLSTATTMSAEEGAVLLAQYANITRMAPQFYGNLASTIVDLGNNYATTEQKITQMMQGIASSASMAGMSNAEIAGLSATVTALGIEAGMGSTQMSSFIGTLQTAVETGEDLKDFARVAGMSAEEFRRAWGENAVDAMSAFVSGLNNVERTGSTAIVTLNNLGISETRMVRMITSMSNSGDLLNRTIETANGAWQANTALTDEAAKRYATTESQLVMLSNSYNNLKIAVGDVFTPALRDSAGAGNEVLQFITKFVEENPNVVRGIAAIVAGGTVLVGGITAYTIATKVAKIATDALSTSQKAMPVLAIASIITTLTVAVVAFAAAAGDADESMVELTATTQRQYDELRELERQYESVSSLFGETSYEAQRLKWEIDDLSAEYERNKQSVAELREETAALLERHNALVEEYQKVSREADIEGASIMSLVGKLEQLSAKSEKTASDQEAIRAIVAKLNEEVPQLGVNYEDVANNVGSVVAAMHSMAEAEALRRKNQADYEEYVKFIGEEEALHKTLKDAINEREKAETDLADAQQAMSAAQKEYGKFGGESAGRAYASAMTPYINAVQKAENALGEAVRTEGEAQLAYNESQQLISDLEVSMGAYSEQIRQNEYAQEILGTTISEITIKAAELGRAYDETYQAAYKSITGQFGLFEQAKTEITLSTSQMIAALKSQADYMATYGENMKKAAEMGVTDGLLAQLSDGSKESAGYLAAIVKSGETKIAELNAEFAKVQEGEEAFSQTVAEMRTGFTAEMELLQQDMVNALHGLNYTDEALLMGQSTINGFIAGADGMVDEVYAAYAKIAQVANDAMYGGSKPNTTGYNNSYGTTQTQSSSYIDYPAAMSLSQSSAKVAEAMVDNSSREIKVEVVNQYSVSNSNGEDISEQLSRHDDDFADKVKRVMADLDHDDRRMSYSST